MRLIITGHREEKLQTYDVNWINNSINKWINILHVERGISIAYSGMASGVELWFCEACLMDQIPYIACVPFEEQDHYMNEETKTLRSNVLRLAKEIISVRNSWMVEHCDYAMVVWDGNKGGTHNVVQQLIEKNIPFLWINPVGKKIWKCE